jgi:parallel beta-helix repeat protein
VGYLSDTPYNTLWDSSNTSVVTVASPGNYSTITCDDVNFGTSNINLWYGNQSNYTTVTVEEWTTDFIRINDAPGGVGSPVNDMAYSVWDTDTFYVAAYNNTHGFVEDVTGDWSSDDDTVGTVTTPGISTTFSAQWVLSDSTCQVDVTWDIFSDSTGILTVLAPTTDYIQIHDAPGGGGSVITSISYYLGETDMFYGVELNATVGYLRAVQASSTWTSTDDTIVGVTSPGSSSTITCSDTNPGSVTITLNDGIFSNSTSVEVLSYTVDNILIRDAPSGGGNDLTDPANYLTFPVGATTTFYGALYNDSQGYIGDVSSIATWTSSDPDIVDPSSPGVFSIITCSDTNYGTADITLEEWTGLTTSTTVTVLEPTIDYMNILDAPDGAGDIVDDIEYEIWETDSFYAAAYNYTAGYLIDTSVEWSSDDTDVGTVTTPGSQTTFTPEDEGTCTVTADYGSGISDTTGTITVTIPLNLTVDDSGGAMFETISEALDYAQDGSTIYVYSGTYYENFTIDLSITLVGEDKQTTIIDGEEAEKVINILSDDVTLKELTIRNGEYNLYNDQVDGTDIRYCIIKEYEYGIYNYKTTDAYIAYNTITNGKYGIVTYEAYNDAIRWNTISYNTEYGAKDYDSELKNCFNWNYFHHNEIAYYYDPDVELSVMEFDGNIFEDNEIAIKVENASTISITNNTFTRNKIGILLVTASPNIIENIISVADFGIYSENSSPMISNNVFSEISDYAIYAKSAESLRIMDNTISDSEIIMIDSNIQELRAEDTTITGINTSLQNVNLDDKSTLEMKWRMHLRIVDSEGESIEGATVLIYDAFDNFISATTSDSEGWIEVVEVLDTIQSGSSTTSHNPYRIVVIKDSKEDTFEITIGEDTTSDISFEGKAQTIQPAGPSIWWAFIFLVGFVGVVGASALLIEVTKFGLISLFLPLYTRLKKEKLLDQPTRERIYGYIIGNPGAHFGLIKEELGLGNGQLVYHLKQLEDAHMVYSREDGAKKRFYPADVPIAKEGTPNISSIQEKLLNVIKDDSGIGQKKLASKMGISRQVAGYHLTKMERKGLINKEVEGRETRYYTA